METNKVDRKGVVAVINRSESFLVVRRSRQVIAPKKLCFPGGGIEGDETEEQAICRELQEELAVSVRPTRRIWSNVTPWNVQLAWWHCELEPSSILIPNPAEVSEATWMTAAELLAQTDLLESNRSFLTSLNAGLICLP